MSQDTAGPQAPTPGWRRVAAPAARKAAPEIPTRRIHSYFDHLARLLRTTQATDAQGRPIALEDAFSSVAQQARKAHERGNKLLFIGNGGSSAIASHMAIDYAKNGNLRAIALNDPATLTCLSNDLGYENVFAAQIEMQAQQGDTLIAISSSGRSENILRAVEVARGRRCSVVTFTGFAAENPLRKRGHLNLWVESSFYGHVEIAHLSLCHAILDLSSPPSGSA